MSFDNRFIVIEENWLKHYITKEPFTFCEFLERNYGCKIFDINDTEKIRQILN